MNVWAELVPFVSLGAFGALHCAGMCGGFSLAVVSGHEGIFARRQAGYVLGKSSSYAVLALLVASGASWLEIGGSHGAGLGHGAVRGALGWAAAVFLVLTGLGLFTRGRWSLLEHGTPRAGLERARSILRGALALPGMSGAFGLGLLNGLIPCGLSWAALVLAAQLPPPLAALGAFCFGLATAPVLLAVALGARMAGPVWRRATPFVLGGVLIVFGVGTAWRSTKAFSAGQPTCCSTSQPG